MMMEVGFVDFATWTLLVVILLGVQVQVVKLQKRVRDLEAQKK